MMVDLGPIIYSVLLVYAVGGILFVLLVSLGAWGIATCVKRLRAEHPAKRARVRRTRRFFHLPHHGRA